MKKMLGGVLALAMVVGSVTAAPAWVSKAGGYAAAPFTYTAKGVKNHHKKTAAAIGAIAAVAAWQAKSKLNELKNDDTATTRSLAIPGLNRVPALRKFVGVELGQKGLKRVFYVASAVAAACALYVAGHGAHNGYVAWDAKRTALQSVQTDWNAYKQRLAPVTARCNAAKESAIEGTLDDDLTIGPLPDVAQDAKPTRFQRLAFWLDTKKT
jgi:hypothetical protein